MSNITKIGELLNKLSIANLKQGVGDFFVSLVENYNALIADFTEMRARLNSTMLTSAGLAIKTGGSAVVKAGTAFVALVGGTPVYKAANTDMAALVGTLATAKSAVWPFYIDDEGTLTTGAKTADADTAAEAIALLPAPASGLTMIGFIVVSNATGSDFVGGTTALDAASVTTAYFNTQGPAAYTAATTATTV